MKVEPVKRRLNNTPYVEQMETWSIPLTEDEKARFAAMSAKGKEPEGED